MLKLDRVSFSFKEPVLQAFSLSLNVGEILHIRGANGAGKTTLLRIVAGVLSPHAGSVSWNGKLLDPQKTKIGYVSSGGGGLYPRLSVQENLEYFGGLMGLNRVSLRERQRAVDPFGIDFWDLPVEECSQGMKQRVLWIRALMHEPEILLLDEAFNAFDTVAEEQAIEILQRGRGGRATLMAQHGKKFSFPCSQLEASRFVNPC